MNPQWDRATLADILLATAYWIILVIFIYACFLKPEPRSLMLSLNYVTQESSWSFSAATLLVGAGFISQRWDKYLHLPIGFILIYLFIWGQV